MTPRSAVKCSVFLTSLIFASCHAAAKDAPCRDVEFQTDRFTVCQFSTSGSDVRIFWGDGDTAYGQFDVLSRVLDSRETHLLFAMNAGMYHEDRSPVGLYIDSDRQRRGLQLKESVGNFGMLPNGVFHISAAGIGVTETKTFKARQLSPKYATQSGPMLVIDNQIHPRFNVDSTSKRIRNGVGVSADGDTVYFSISEKPVNFFKFASLFKDELQTPNALYFDGVVSRLFDAASGRHDLGMAMGPIVAVVETDAAGPDKESEK